MLAHKIYPRGNFLVQPKGLQPPGTKLLQYVNNLPMALGLRKPGLISKSNFSLQHQYIAK